MEYKTAVDKVQFQFHKGTIKTQASLAKMSLDQNFNSIKVRLKQRSQILNLLNDKFQFHKGTIKTIAGGVSAGGALLFQFHKGTIKTFRRRSIPILSNSFQFHKGTIKTD